jgi:hypothetical protein
VFVQLLVAAAFLPWFETFAAQVLLVQRGFWIPEPTGVLLPWTVSTFAGSPALAALVIPVAGWGLWRSRGPAQPGAGLAPIDVIAPWLTVPILLPMLLSIVGSPIVLPKYTIAASIPLALCTGRGIAALPRRWMQVGTGLAIAALAASALTQFYAARRKDGWRDAVWNLEAAARPGDAVIFYPFFNELPFDVYSRRTDLTRLPAPRHAQLLTGPTLGRLVEHLARPHDRVWLVVLQLDPRKPLLVDALQRICPSVRRIREWHIDIYFCERPR